MSLVEPMMQHLQTDFFSHILVKKKQVKYTVRFHGFVPFCVPFAVSHLTGSSRFPIFGVTPLLSVVQPHGGCLLC